MASLIKYSHTGFRVSWIWIAGPLLIMIYFYDVKAFIVLIAMVGIVALASFLLVCFVTSNNRAIVRSDFMLYFYLRSANDQLSLIDSTTSYFPSHSNRYVSMRLNSHRSAKNTIATNNTRNTHIHKHPHTHQIGDRQISSGALLPAVVVGTYLYGWSVLLFTLLVGAVWAAYQFYLAYQEYLALPPEGAGASSFSARVGVRFFPPLSY